MGLFDAVRPGYFDHARLVADLRDTSKEIENSHRRGKNIRPPLAFLHRLGKDMIHATDGDLGALRLRREPTATESLAAVPFGAAFSGSLEFNWLMAAIILARDDLAEKFSHAGQLSFDKGLQWLILHGVTEHRLWHVITPSFVSQLVGNEVPGTGLTPLQLMVVRERPGLARLFKYGHRAHNDAVFSRWLVDQGHIALGLFWCLPPHHARRRRNRRIAASVTTLVARPSRERLKALWQTPKALALLMAPETDLVVTAPLVQEAQGRIALLHKIDPATGSAGRPLCFWSGMAGELAILHGQHEAANHQGVPISGSALTFVAPDPKSRPHTIVLETLCEDSEASIASCRVNGRRSPVVRLADGPRHLWLFDVSPDRPTAETTQHKAIINQEATSIANGHIVSLGFSPKRQTGDCPSPFILSRLWSF